MTGPIQLELHRAFAMSAAWDEAAEALKRLDTQGFDRAMSNFRSISNQGAGAAEEAARRNHGN